MSTKPAFKCIISETVQDMTKVTTVCMTKKQEVAYAKSMTLDDLERTLAEKMRFTEPTRKM